MTPVHVVVPEGIADPARPSGGNTYDRHVIAGLEERGWTVRRHAVPTGDEAALAATLRRIPDRAAVLVDGLLASPAPAALVPEAGRLRQVVLVHMPFGHRPAGAAGAVRASERAVLFAAEAVIATSAWSRRRLVELYRLPAGQVHVAEPGVAPAGRAPGSGAGDALLCVAAVASHKGHDVLVDALAATADLPWRCECVGSLDRDPAFAARVRRRVRDRGLDGRVRFAGPRTGEDLDGAYASADLLVLPSHEESYGMVVTEALARGIPVLASDVGGVPEALGCGDDGCLPGMLVRPGDPAALGAALRRWLEAGVLRSRLRTAAAERRRRLPRWAGTTATVADVLQAVAR